MGLVLNDGKEEYIYYNKTDYKLVHPIYEKPENDTKFIKVPKLVINSDFKDKVVQLGDLVDNHSGEKTSDSLACLATSILLSRQLGNKYTTLIGNHEIAHIAMGGYGAFKKNNECKNFIIEAIKNGEIKLFQHTPGTNIINSHVPLLRDNIINFLNTPILQDIIFNNYTEEVKQLTNILRLKKENDEKEEKCLLDIIPPKEEDIKNFVEILNKLFSNIIISGNEIAIKSLLRTLVNGDRLNIHENGEKNLENIDIESLKNSVFKGITNIVGHDATPIGLRGGIYSKKQQKIYYDEIKILFTDEWQGKGEAKCIKIETNEKGENVIFFYREENIVDDKAAEFVKDDFDNNKKVKESANLKSATAAIVNAINKSEKQNIENANKETSNTLLSTNNQEQKMN